MPLYSVSLLLKSVHSTKPDASPLWEERIVLVKASSEDDAKNEGLRIGKNAEHEYPVVDNENKSASDTVRWIFVQIERVYQIENEGLKNGTELFSRYLRDSEVKSLLTPFED
jgi:hypothetical protein